MLIVTNEESNQNLKCEQTAISGIELANHTEGTKQNIY